MAIQNKIYIGFASNIKEWMTNPSEFVKEVEKNHGTFLFIVIKSEDKEAFINEYKPLFIDKIYDKRSCQYAVESDTYQEIIEDLKFEIDKKKMSNENTEILIAKNTEFFNIIKDSGITCKSISEIDCLTKEKPKSSSLSDNMFIATMMQRKNIIESAGITNTKKKIALDPPPVNNKPNASINLNSNPIPPKSNEELLKNKASLMGKLPGANPEKKDPRTIVELEKAILGSNFVEEDIPLSYSKLDDAKAQLINCLSDRLIDHINVLYPEIKNLNLKYPDYIKVFEIFNKAADSNSFLNLWMDKFPNNAIKSSQEVFEKIRNETAYYTKVCNFLYSEDVFDVFKV